MLYKVGTLSINMHIIHYRKREASRRLRSFANLSPPPRPTSRYQVLYDQRISQDQNYRNSSRASAFSIFSKVRVTDQALTIKFKASYCTNYSYGILNIYRHVFATRGSPLVALPLTTTLAFALAQQCQRTQRQRCDQRPAGGICVSFRHAGFSATARVACCGSHASYAWRLPR